jgi:deazaflavin-dependent oxidoreductase (nitroreductase family)
VSSDDQAIAEFRRNGGRLGGDLAGTPIVLLHHRGARSGIERVTPLAYQRALGGLVIVGSNGGSPVEPGWCRNLRAHPLIDVEVGDGVLAVRAQELDDAARRLAWPSVVAWAPQLAEYQARVARRFPLFLLTPETEGSHEDVHRGAAGVARRLRARAGR